MSTNNLQSGKRVAAFLTLLAISFIGCGDAGDFDKLQARSKSVSVNER